jgi:hypothetical protein
MTRLDKKLQKAIHQEDLNKIKHLIETGANVNFQGRYGRTALMTIIFNQEGYAYGHDDIENLDNVFAIIEYLILAGADVNIVDDEGGTALYYARQMREVGDVYGVELFDLEQFLLDIELQRLLDIERDIIVDEIYNNLERTHRYADRNTAEMIKQGYRGHR